MLILPRPVLRSPSSTPFCITAKKSPPSRFSTGIPSYSTLEYTRTVHRFAIRRQYPLPEHSQYSLSDMCHKSPIHKPL